LNAEFMRRILPAGTGDRQNERDTGLARTILEIQILTLNERWGMSAIVGKGARFASNFG
jgi:hypothetical protein